MVNRNTIIELIQEAGAVVNSFEDKKNFTSILTILNQPAELTTTEFKKIKNDIDILYKSLSAKCKEKVEQQIIAYVSDALELLKTHANSIKKPILQSNKIFFLKKNARPKSHYNSQGIGAKTNPAEEKAMPEKYEYKASDQYQSAVKSDDVPGHQQTKKSHPFWSSRGVKNDTSSFYAPLLLGYPSR